MSAEVPAPDQAVAELERAPIRRACVVLLGGRPFAVDIADAREVIVLDTLTRVPGAPAPVLGIMNLRGVVLAVVDARPLLGLPARPAAGRGRALVLADGGRRAAMQIERVLGLTVFEHVPPSTERASHGELAVGELAGEPGGPATLLDARAVLAALRRPWDSVLGGS